MNHSTLSKSKFLLTLIAGVTLMIGLPIGADAGAGSGAYDAPTVKQMKVKDHKVKVKVVGGKAKFKIKANGKEKVKIKGRNGQLAAQIAENARGPVVSPVPYFGK